MRILQINCLYEPLIGGGAEIVLKNLVEGLQKKGYEVKVLSLWNKEDIEETINQIPVYRAKIPNIYLPYKEVIQPFFKRRLWHLFDIYNPLSKRKAQKQIKAFNPDIIQVHNTPGWSCSIWDAAFESKIPCVQTLHDLYLACSSNMFKNNKICKKRCIICRLMKFPYKVKSGKIKAVVGVSNFILDTYLRYGYFNNIPIKRVICNSINSFTQTDATQNNLHGDYINFGFIGTLAPNKGIEPLLIAFNKVKHSNWSLFIAGSGKHDYEEYLKSTYADKSIIFMGHVKPEEFYSRVDVTIVPSRCYEALGMVGIESLSFGKPVLGSNIGGIPEMITENINGLMFDPYNENDLIEKLFYFANNIDKWRRKSEIIKKSAVKFLDYDKWIAEWEDLYKEILK